MAIDTETGIVYNIEDREAYEAKKAAGRIAKVPRGKIRNPDGSEVDISSL